MLRLLQIALLVGGAVVAIEFVGAALENRANSLHAMHESSRTSLATAPPSLVPETRN
jgi:hypothetical protein